MSMSRRNFFRRGAAEAAQGAIKALESLGKGFQAAMKTPAPSLLPYLRPPGALDELDFLRACTRCDACIRDCPHYAVRKAGHDYGPKVQDTPIILPEKAPCYLCEDLPCIAACDDGALLPILSPAATRMGLARVDATLCYAAQGTDCVICEERCPIEPKAINVTPGIPAQVIESTCTGCGICAFVCPPHAIDILAAHTL